LIGLAKVKLLGGPWHGFSLRQLMAMNGRELCGAKQ
jgi:hypothetical protein